MTNYRSAIERAFTGLFRELSKLRSEARMGLAVGRGASGDVTRVLDALAERSLIDSFRGDIPNCAVVSEEAGILEGAIGAPVVLMDPIDGTTNAVRGLPVFSAAAAVLDGRTFASMKAAGVVELVSGEMIIGDGTGTFVNGVKQKPSNVSKLFDALVSYELKVRVERPKRILERINELVAQTKHPRVLGSAALEIAYVAIGKIDAYVSPGKQLRSYDCLPSIFLVRVAGGFAQGIGHDLDKIDVMSKERISFVVAGNKKLGKRLVDEFSNADP